MASRIRSMQRDGLFLVFACLPALSSAQSARVDYGLSFGAFIPPSAGAGTVTVPSTGGPRLYTGGVWLLGFDAGSPAQLALVNAADRAYSVQLPAEGEVVLSNGSQTMQARAFTASPVSGTASASQTLRIGATLDVGPRQATGRYEGSFRVTINLN